MNNKKILLLVSRIGPNANKLLSELRKEIGVDSVFLSELSDLFFRISGDKIEVRILSLNKDILEFDFVYFRKSDERLMSVAGSLALCLDYLNIDYADKIYRDLGPFGDKFTSLIKFSLSGFPVLPSVFCWGNRIKDNLNRIVSFLGFPLVAKEFSLQHGKGVRVIRKKEDFGKLFEEINLDNDKQFIFQKFIEIDREYRLLTIGGKVRSAQRMYRDTSGFELKIDWEKREEFLPLSSVTDQMKYLAVKASKIVDIQIAGVDLAIEKGTKSVYLFEVNRGPGFTYDANISPEISVLADFFKEKIYSDQKPT